MGLKQGLPEAIAREAGGKIFTFGSYRLGVHGAGADIDTLCVVPKHVEREVFFTKMPEILKARPEVQELTVFPTSSSSSLASISITHKCKRSWPMLMFQLSR